MSSIEGENDFKNYISSKMIFVHNFKWIKCNCYVLVYEFFMSLSLNSKSFINSSSLTHNILPQGLRGSLNVVSKSVILKIWHIFLPKSLNSFKSLGITNLNWLEIFDRGRRCDLNLKNWLECDVLNPTLNICSSLCAKIFWYINAHIEGEQMICEKGSLHLSRSKLRLDSWIDKTPLS